MIEGARTVLARAGQKLRTRTADDQDGLSRGGIGLFAFRDRLIAIVKGWYPDEERPRVIWVMALSMLAGILSAIAILVAI